jgi:CHAT domain-containing protein
MFGNIRRILCGAPSPAEHPRRRPPQRLLLCLLGSLLIPATVFPRAPEAADSTLDVTPGRTASKEIPGGAVQTFELSLAEQHYLRLSVSKGDLNLSFVVYGPRGQKVFEGVSHRYETLRTSLVAELAGTYRIEVRSLETEAAGRPYELRVEAERVATALDFKDAAASEAAAAAGRLRAEWQETPLRKAIEKYMEAWRVWRSAGYAQDAAAALVGAAEAHYALGEYGRAVRLYTKAAVACERAGNQLCELESISHAGVLKSYLGDDAGAQKHLDRALDYFARRGGMRQPAQVIRAHAKTLSHAGEVYYLKGELVKASRYLEQALGLWAAVGDRGGEAHALLFTGYITLSSGERDKALEQFERALALSRALADRSGEARALTVMGTVRSLKGEEQAALGLHSEAGRIFRAIGDGQNEAVTLNGVGQAYEDLSEWQTALDNYQQALKLARASDSHALVSATVYKVARAYRSLGDIPQALGYYQQCISLSRAANRRRMEAYALNDIAAIYGSQGKRRQALDQYYKILKLYRAVGDRRGQSITLNSIGDHFSATGDEKSALAFYKQALELGQASGDREVEISTLYNVARAARAASDLEGALAHVEQSLALIETLRTYVASPELRSSYFASVHKHYELYVDLLMQLDRQRPGQGFAAAALLANERARARSLLESLAESGTDIRVGADAALLERERALHQELTTEARRQRELASSGESHAEADEAAREVRRLTAEYQMVQARMREQSPRYKALTQPRPLRLDEIQAALGDEDTVLLEYGLGEKRSYLWVVTPRSFAAYELPARAAVEKVAREVYNLLTARQADVEEDEAGYGAKIVAADGLYRERALGLSRMLLGPVAGQLGEKRLLIVAEGVLQYIPFDALPAPEQESDEPRGPGDDALLVSHHEVVTLPSISTLVGIRRERARESPPGGVVAILADPVFSSRDARLQGTEDLLAGAEPTVADERTTRSALRTFRDSGDATNLPRLRHALKEAEAITAVAPSGSWMLAKGFAACRETAMSDAIGRYQIVHFATHSLVNSEHPELSGIVLSMLDERGTRKDGFLQLHDIYNLNLSADLVVLSACDTGLGKDVKGEGIVGLTRGFMYAGSKGVVASLWKVDDRATAELMRHFYKALLQEGLPPAAALRSAKQAMRRQKPFAAPYFWAAFQLQGEYVTGVRVGGDHLPAAAIVLTIMLASAGLWVLARRVGRSRPK